MRLLQVCNVGNIVGGTAACAWSVTQALPDFEHFLWFRSKPTPETKSGFSTCQVHTGDFLSRDTLHSLKPDLILLHNTPATGVDWESPLISDHSVVIYYQHSLGKPDVKADSLVVCSESLKQSSHQPDVKVLYQGVPLAQPVSASPKRDLSEELIVGRICTPVKKKWPPALLGFYQKLGQQFPQILWEFVSCPESLQSSLCKCLFGKARFYPAGWSARSMFHRWHLLLYSQPELTETFGRTCAEAMRCGCVPVVDDSGGFCEQVKTGTGYLCSKFEDFEQALTSLSEPGHWSGPARTYGVLT